MKNSELWAQYQDYTRELTAHSRKLAVAAAGVCWLFKDDSGAFPILILVSLLFVVLFFLFDLGQPFIAVVLYRWWIRREEVSKYRETGSIEGEYDKPAWLDKPVFGLWFMKVPLVLLSWLFAVAHVVRASI
jgi:hypothetical protein